MKGFRARWKGKEYQRHYRARRKTYSTAKRANKDMQRLCAIDYQILVRDNLVSQKFVFLYPKYGKKYAQYKLRTVGHLKTWRLFDDLFNSITAFRIGGTTHSETWMGGVPDTARNREGKSIAMYGKTVEFGHSRVKFKKRPLFIPTGQLYSRKKWPERGQQALNKVKRQWK